MFEEEAKKIADKLVEKGCVAIAEGRVRQDIQYAFQKGAEFVYRVNEWHYPSKGEYPKDDKDMLMSKTLLLVTKMKGSDCLSLALGQYNFSTQEFSYQHIVGLTDVIAWKEIVLPLRQ